jgi:hypothetical protein
MVSRMVGNEAAGGLCPGCHLPFDTGKRRRLLDSCGHERCYSCTFRQEECPVCRTLGGSRADQENLYHSLKSLHRAGPSPGPLHRPLRGASPAMDPDCLYGSVAGLAGRRGPQPTPPPGRRPGPAALPSPAPGARRTWLQRHARRPQTVNIDETTMSGGSGDGWPLT